MKVTVNLIHVRSTRDPRQPPLHSRPLLQMGFKGIAQRHQRIDLRDDAVHWEYAGQDGFGDWGLKLCITEGVLKFQDITN